MYLPDKQNQSSNFMRVVDGPKGATGPTDWTSPPSYSVAPPPSAAQVGASIISVDSLTLFFEGKSYTVPKSHVNYKKVADAVRAKDYKAAVGLIDVAKAINNWASGRVTVVNGAVLYDGEVLHNVMTDRLLSMLREGFDVKPFAKFMEKLMQNPSRTAVDELYLFLESGNLPITEDGSFLAYKKVSNDLKDIYTGKFDHSPGKLLEMPRNKVDDRRDNTCSYGFHFCTISYLPHYGAGPGGSRVVIVKINPADVVSIPSDYANAKGRTCRYEVVGEYTGEWDKGVTAWDAPVVDEYEENDYYAPVQRNYSDAQRAMPLRDPDTGRFVAKYSPRWYQLQDEVNQGY